MKALLVSFMLCLSISAQAQSSGADLRAFALTLLTESSLVHQAHLPPDQEALLEELFFEFPAAESTFQKTGSVLKAIPADRVERFLAQTGSTLELDPLLHAASSRRAIALRNTLAHSKDLLGTLLTQGNLSELLADAHLADSLDGFSPGKITENYYRDLLQEVEKALHQVFPGAVLPTAQLETEIQKASLLARQQLGQELLKRSESEVLAGLSLIPEIVFTEMAVKLDDAIRNLDFSRAPSVEALLSVDFNLPNQDMSAFAKMLLSGYFDRGMPMSTKRNILTGVLSLKPNEHESRLAVTVLKNTDILFKKAVQFFSDRSPNEEFKRIGNELKAELGFLSEAQLEAILNKNLDASQRAAVSGIKQVAAATTAVGALAQYKGRAVFIKIQRPGILSNLNKDATRLKYLARGQNGVVSIIESIIQGVKQELSLKTEIVNYEIAKILYEEPGKNLSIPTVLRALPASDELFFMTVAPGKNLARVDLKQLSNEDLLTLEETNYSALKLWFKRSMSLGRRLNSRESAALKNRIKSIYEFYYPDQAVSEEWLENDLNKFHGDLHSGNVFIDFEQKIDQQFGISWIDWGNTHALTLGQKRGQISLLLAAVLKDPHKIFDAMNGIAVFNESQKARFLYQISSVIHKQTGTRAESVNFIANMAVAMATEMGVMIPPAIVNWGRGKGMVENGLAQVTQEADARGLVRTKNLSAKRAYLEVMASYLRSSLPAQLFSADARGAAVLPLRTVADFVREGASQLLGHYCNLELETHSEQILDGSI